MPKKPVASPTVIPFADGLEAFLPVNYLGNHALLPQIQRDAMAEDNRRWFLAHTMFEPRRSAVGLLALERVDQKIREGLALMHPMAYRDDMRRRLKILRGDTK